MNILNHLPKIPGEKPRILQILSLLAETYKMWPVTNVESLDTKQACAPLRKPGGKWAPPKENAATEKDIDGKPYHWNEDNHWWYKSNNNHHQAYISHLANNIMSSG